jgi:hypothetical protein
MGGVASAPERVVGPSGRYPNLRGFAHPIDLRSGALLLHGEFRDQAIAFCNALFKIIDSNDQPERAVVNVS